MPRIHDAILECVVYLYPTAQAASDGEAIGGTGFLVFLPSEKHDGYGFPYVITNSHVIREGGSPVVRLNTKDGDRAIHAYSEGDWIHHPDGDDLAAAPIALTDLHRYQMLPLKELAITPEFIDEHGVGPGDETYMVGRFVNHEGRQQNTPTVRFGAIAQMNVEPIPSERGFMQESFLIEGRSIPGYSGAPVFLYLDLGTPRPGGKGTSLMLGNWQTRLLGVDWCHLNQQWSVLDKTGEAAADDDGHTPGYHVIANTGMMGVIPAWKLLTLLNCEEFVAQRADNDRQISAKKAASPATADEAT